MSRVFAGFDVGGQSMKAALVDESGAVLSTDTVETGAGMSPAELAEAVTSLLERFAGSGPIAALGCGVAGCVTKDGTLRGCPNLPNLCDVSLEDTLAKSTGLTVAVDNDAHCHALAEGWTGAAAGVENFLLVALGSGLGSGVVLDGRVFRGQTGYGCELGHMIVHASGRRCACGNLGCFEAYASEMGIRQAVGAAAKDFAARVEARLAAGANGHAAAVFGMADEEDGAAVAVVDDFVEVLGIGLASAVNVFDVTTIVLGGGIAPGVLRRMAALRRALDGALFARNEDVISILPASAGRWAGAVGAARLSMFSL
jgi:glucokinase